MSLEIGSTLGDYQIIGVLGAGGMGRVYKVRNTISDRIEAMKVLLPDLATAPELADRFMREIKVQASLEHPHIAALHTAVRVENQLLMLMEYLEGITLEQRLQQGKIAVTEAVEYIRQVLSALDYAHQRGVIHRDIKPANMMVTAGGTLKLMDFGIAKAAGDQRLTMTGTTMGSLYYMSPEQIKGAADLDARADLYSVGVSLYELVTGKRPFDGDSQFAIMSAHLEKTPVPPVTIDPSLPESLNDLILMSVAKDPNERFQTAGAFRNALGAFSSALAAPTVPIPAPPPPIPAAVPPAMAAAAPAAAVAAAPAGMAPQAQPRSKRGLWMALGAVAAVLAVVGVVQFGPWKGAKAAPEALAPEASVPAPQQTPAATPASPQPAVAQPSETTPAPAQTAGQNTAVAPPVAAPPQKPASQPVTRQARQSTPRNPEPAVSHPAVAAQAVQQAPVQAPPQTVPVQQQPVNAAASQPAMDEGRRAAIMQFREHLMMLSTRAESVRGTLRTMSQQQNAAGLNLRGDMRESLDMMNSYMKASQDALRANDLRAAHEFADKAEQQLDKLEKFLNR